MNNIEILEKFIEDFKEIETQRKEVIVDYEYLKEKVKVIEALLQEYKKMNEIKLLFENNMLGYISGYEDGYNIRTGLPYQVVKHFADDKLTLRLNQYKEDYLKVRKLLDESIPKSKVKEKIKELEKEIENINNKNDGYWEDTSIILDEQKQVLKELLEGE